MDLPPLATIIRTGGQWDLSDEAHVNTAVKSFAELMRVALADTWRIAPCRPACGAASSSNLTDCVINNVLQPFRVDLHCTS